ncbi:hypothetical protein TNCV_3336751 [Trichonephila clavipes]|nr:hypothetical protein TNCV_3336751 [Trichonephila clavipes]
MSDRCPQPRVRCMPVVSHSFLGEYILPPFHTNFEGEVPGGGQVSTSFPSTNLTRGHAALWLLRVTPCRKGIHLQISMPSPRFEPRPYNTAVSVANHYTGWAGEMRLIHSLSHFSRYLRNY